MQFEKVAEHGMAGGVSAFDLLRLKKSNPTHTFESVKSTRLEIRIASGGSRNNSTSHVVCVVFLYGLELFGSASDLGLSQP